MANFFDRYKQHGEVDGSEEKSSVPDVVIIPGGTVVLAELISLEWDCHPETQYEKIRGEWVITTDEPELASINGRHVFQNIDVNHEDEKTGELSEKAYRAANMALRLLMLTDTDPDSTLSDECLAEAVGLIAGIHIEFYQIDDNVGNFISGVSPSKGLDEKLGTKMPKEGGGDKGKGKGKGNKAKQRSLDIDEDDEQEEAPAKKGKSRGKW